MDPAMSSGPVGVVVSDTSQNTTDRYLWAYLPVAPNVVGMTAHEPRLAYEDLLAPGDLRADCEAVVRTLPAVSTTAPSLLYDDFPREVRKPEIRISDAAKRIADALELHLD